jgi:DNA polymerase-3 subunit epsilon
LKKAGRFRNGWVQLLVVGVGAPAMTARTAAGDNNTVLFTYRNRDQFLELHTWLQRVAAINHERGAFAYPADVDHTSEGQADRVQEPAAGATPARERVGGHRVGAPAAGAERQPRRPGQLKSLWLRRRAARLPTKNSPIPFQAMPSELHRAAGVGFAVVDVETTGLSARWDRIAEIAVIHTDSAGRVTDEWTTLINPDGPVGATRIHQITAADVRRAPRFADVVGELTTRLVGRALVAHNARFDLAFLRKEYSRAGWDMPTVPHLCTLDASWAYLPDLSRRRLPDCCWASGVQLNDAHSALGDARATAGLLGYYLDSRRPPQHQHLQLPLHASKVSWPPVPHTPVTVALRDPGRAQPEPAAPGRLATLLDALPLSSVLEEGAPTVAAAYVELLAEALEDGVLTDAEAASLAELATTYALTRQQVDTAHRGLLLALAHKAVEDGKITRVERGDLLATAAVLGFPDAVIKAVLDEANTALTAQRSQDCRPLPEAWRHGEPLRIDQRVAFTGGDDIERARLEGRAQAAGLRVTGSVSRQTAVLVTDGVDGQTAKAKAAREIGTRTVTLKIFGEMVAFVQPATSSTTEAAVSPRRSGPVRHRRAAAHAPVDLSSVDPSEIRTWARAQGQPVGERGRLSIDLIAAYRTAHPTPDLEN